MGKILITGGAGFVGSHLADELLAHGYEVRALDNLSPQVHGPSPGRPAYLAPEVELLVGDVRDRAAVLRALEGVSGVFHLAASVGVGQSMYRIEDYTATNCLGTAVLLEALARGGSGAGVERLVVASSMSIYGEGRYRTARGGLVDDAARSLEQLRERRWEIAGPEGELLEPTPTPEEKRAVLSSVYAISKYHQEQMCLTLGSAYRIPTVALRFFNIYGPRQALSNPYTGVLAIFAARLLNDRPPRINEDGLQKRDFVHVRDVARACRLALETPGAEGGTFNIGSGTATAILEVARLLAGALGKEWITPEMTGCCRVGDIRNCFAEIARARNVLGYEPTVRLAEGLCEMAEWLPRQRAEDCCLHASRELEKRGLTV